MVREVPLLTLLENKTARAASAHDGCYQISHCEEQMEMSQSVRDRIFAAADTMYAETNRSRFPTVDAVRKRAGVNMNDASSCMKEWRRSQASATNPAPPQLPAELQTTCMTAVSTVWEEATKIAFEALRAAQAGWESERAELDELSRQMAAAYDLQAAELAAAQAEIAQLKGQLEAASSNTGKIQAALDAAEKERSLADRAASEAAVRAHEINKRADELQQGLTYARDEASKVRAEMEGLRVAHAEQVERVRVDAKGDLENERARCERERERYQTAATQALAEAAQYRGKLEALESNHSGKGGPARASKQKLDGAVKGDGKRR